jgi:hypothetical protein
MLCRDYKGKNTDRLVTRIDPGVVPLVAELATGGGLPRSWANGGLASISPSPSTHRLRRSGSPCC